MVFVFVFIGLYIIIGICLSLFVTYLTAKNKINENICPCLWEDEPIFNTMICLFLWPLVLLFTVICIMAFGCRIFITWFYNCFKEDK